MKKGILYGSLFGFGLVLFSVVVLTKTEDKEYYTPRQTVSSEDGHKGAAEWLHAMRANQITGEIDPNDLLNARNQVYQYARAQKKSTLGLTWENMGPNDIGGRTRAFIIDNQNPDIMYAGSVSGGLFKSINAGASWAPVNDHQDNLAVVSIAQASNGDIYYGTGEDMYYGASGTGTGGIYGGGMFKSTDGGNSFQLLTSTIPQPNGDWRSIAKIVIDPNNSNLIYAAQTRGLSVSEDGGNTWTNPIIGASAMDMTIDGSGHVWVKQGTSIYKSDGTPNGFTEISKANAGPTELPRNAGRSRIAVSPQDENYVYVISTGTDQNFDKAFRSTDGGQTWSVIGQRNMYLNPHNGGSGSQGQGTFDNAVTVDANNKDRIMVGGVTFYEWTLTGGWQLTATTGGGNGGNPYYVHADMHNVVWHPTKPNHVFALNDGGIFRSKDNGVTWSPISKGYVSAQYYSIGVGYNGEMMGGTQDNGTIFIDPANYYAESGVRTPGVNFKGAIRDGDGGYAELSKLDTEIMFKEMQLGIMGRSLDGGETYDAIYDFARMDPFGDAGSTGSDGYDFAGFVMPFLLWEKLNDPKSIDSLTFSADSLVENFGFGSGDSVFAGKFVSPSFNKNNVDGTVINTVANLLFDGFTLEAGSVLVTLDPSDTTLVGASLSSSSFARVYNDPANNNLPTLEYEVVFKTPINNDLVISKVPISYDPGDKVILKSRTDDIDIIHTLTNGANSITNAKVRVQDHVQSMFFVGLRGNNLNTPAGNPNSAGGIWMTRSALTNKTSTPEWYHIGEIANGETPQSMAVSGDGDMLFVGTSGGRIYRFSNLSNARDSASSDVDDFYVSSTNTRPSTSIIEKTIVQTFPGRAVTSIATHPFDNNKLVVTLGNYGNTNYVYYSNNAAAPVPTLLQKDLGNTGLPDFPVYSSTFNYNASSGVQVLIGTDYGVYTTDDISASAVTWTQENTGMANVPVFDLIQQLTVRYDLKPTFAEGFYEGAIYAGTHGRGIFKTNSTADYIGIKEVKPSEIAEKSKMLNVYPNPTTDKIFIDLSLEARTDVTVLIRNINGQLVKNVTYNKLSADVENLEVGVSNLAKGTYVITLTKGGEVISGKFIKQ